MGFDDEQLERILLHIKSTWRELMRSNRHLLRAAIDPKVPQKSDRWPVYVSARENIQTIESQLRACMQPEDFKQIHLRPLPPDHLALEEHGLLYLPHPYIVPGGRFTECYGWDTAFIVRGLLRQGEVNLAKYMVDDQLYEIMHYGTILNANRTYYLTRSQPPLLTDTILNVFKQTRDRAWLRTTVPAIESYYRYWTEGLHLTSKTGLSRYHDLGCGPAPEVVSSELDEQGRNHYERVKTYYRARHEPDHDYGYDVTRYYDAEADQLTDLFYISDRSMRESGCDPSNRFGLFNVGVTDYNPVCLNVLLYLMEAQTADILSLLREREAAVIWQKRANAREALINEILWDKDTGLYQDYNVELGAHRNYPFATTFFPLWAGIASDEQAQRIVANLPLFEQPGGLRTSTNTSFCQWDAPWGWPPFHLIVVEGLRRYGYEREANRISINFLSLVLKEFALHNAIFEKYDVETRGSDTQLQYGYTSNEIGFGWTNATFIELLAGLPRLPYSGVGVCRSVNA